MVLAKNQYDWSRLIALTPKTDLKNRPLAFYYAGLDVPPKFQEMASLACAELQKWDTSLLKMYCLLLHGFMAVQKIHSFLWSFFAVFYYHV